MSFKLISIGIIFFKLNIFRKFAHLKNTIYTLRHELKMISTLDDCKTDFEKFKNNLEKQVFNIT
jgi:hypothetical protein